MVLRKRVGQEEVVGQILEVVELSFIWPPLLSKLWLSLIYLCCDILTYSTTGPVFRKLLSNHQILPCLIHSSVYRVLMLPRSTGAADHQLSILQHSLSPSESWTSRKGAGPQIRTVPSSEALANSPGRTGFQLTQLTVRVWPVSSAMGSSLRRCQM